MNSFLIIGAGVLQIPMAHEIQALGMRALMTDGDAHAPGKHIADGFLQADTYSLHETQQAVRQWLDQGETIVGVATCGADVAPTVAFIATSLGLPGIPAPVAFATHDKFSVRHALSEHHLDCYQPEWQLMVLDDGLYTLEALTKHYGAWGGLVVKPCEARASRGLTVCQSLDDIPVALERLRPHINTGRMSPEFLNNDRTFLIEQPLQGTEHSAEIIYQDADMPVFFNIVDRKFSYTDGVAMETGHISPSILPEHAWHEIFTMVRLAAEACRVQWGPFKCDVIYTDDGPKILECTARLSGGFDCQETVYFSRRNPIGQVIDLATGRPATGWPQWNPLILPEYTASHGSYGACAAAFPKPGRILWIDADLAEDVKRMPGVSKVYMLCERGGIIEPYTDCAQRPAFVIAHGKSSDEAWECAMNAAEALALAIIATET